jgi:hypothetical protein
MSEEDTLEETKGRISARYLGTGGIHGVGVSRADNAVRLYVSAEAALDDARLEEIQRLAAPFGVVVIRSSPPGFPE